MGYKYNIIYNANGKIHKTNHSKTADFEIMEEIKGDIFTLTLLPKTDITFQKFEVTGDISFSQNSKFFVNGYQSWTVSREYAPNEDMRADFNPKFLSVFDKKKLNIRGIWGAGDLTFHKYPEKAGIFYGYSYAYIRNENDIRLFASLSEKNGYTIITFDTNKSSVTIEKDLEGVKFKSGEEIDILEICDIIDESETAFDKYFEIAEIKKPTAKRMCGYTTWYNYYTSVTEEIVKRDLESISKLDSKIDIFQVDDGYERTVGDWLIADNKKFPSGMKSVADNIHSHNMLAGLWLAPFAATPKSYIYRKHKDWFVKDKDGKIPFASQNWGGFYALDIYNEEVRRYLKKVFDTVLNTWGYDMVKLDFLYACCIIPYNNKSRGEIMCDAMELLRSLCGDKLILGCGVPLAPAFGKVDFCRIGADMALSWNKKPFSREDVSTKHALLNTIFRRQLDGRAFLNDPDVFLLRDNNIKMPFSQRKLIAKTASLFGNLLFVSDDVSTYNNEQKECFATVTSQNKAKIKYVDMNRNGDISIKYSLDDKNIGYCLNINNGTEKKYV